jgi:hypothetical protein
MSVSVGIPDADLTPEMRILLVGRAVHHRSLDRDEVTFWGHKRRLSKTLGHVSQQ